MRIKICARAHFLLLIYPQISHSASKNEVSLVVYANHNDYLRTFGASSGSSVEVASVSELSSMVSEGGSDASSSGS